MAKKTIIRFDDALALKSYREKRKVTQQEAGEAIGAGSKAPSIHTFFHNFRTGNRKAINIEIMDAACEYYGCDYNFLRGLPSVHDQIFKKAQEWNNSQRP